MPELALSRAQAAEEAENAGANDSSNPTMGDIIAARFSRRDLLRGRPRRHGDFNTTPSFTFKEARADDRHDVADGYDADLLIRWGDAVLARTGRNDGLWALETEGEARHLEALLPLPQRRGVVRPLLHPDDETLFLVVQHPGEADDDAKEPLLLRQTLDSLAGFPAQYAASARHRCRHPARGRQDRGLTLARSARLISAFRGQT